MHGIIHAIIQETIVLPDLECVFDEQTSFYLAARVVEDYDCSDKTEVFIICPKFNPVLCENVEGEYWVKPNNSDTVQSWSVAQYNFRTGIFQIELTYSAGVVRCTNYVFLVPICCGTNALCILFLNHAPKHRWWFP